MHSYPLRSDLPMHDPPLYPTACTGIANSVGPITCTTAQDSRGDVEHGFAALPGYWHNTAGPADTCVGMWLLVFCMITLFTC